jgi:hypothetical protein
MTMFPDKRDVMRSLVTQTPFFLEKLNDANLRARGVWTLAEYFDRYDGLLMEFTEQEKLRIAHVCEIARSRCRSAGFTHLFDVNWNFAKCSNRLENGYPHTIGGVIVIPEHALRYGEDRLARLIVHEVTHVHQRAYPNFASRQVRTLGFEPVRRWASHRESLRANPDTNNMIYALDRHEANPILHRDARSLAEVYLGPCKGYPGFSHVRNPEHPFEIIAELNAMSI